jgi:hypothetical protein
MNCGKFLAALEARDNSRLKIQFDVLSSTIGEIPSDNATQGTGEIIEKWIDLLNDSHCVVVDPGYGIVDTNPRQAEIRITSMLNGNSYICDFWLVEGSTIQFHTMHE